MRGPSGLWVLLTLAVAFLAAAVSFRPEPASASGRRPTVLARIDRFREETWRWQDLMGQVRTPTEHSARRVQARSYRRWVLELWRKRAGRARALAGKPPHLGAWLCIHRYEGPWNDPGAPYYGGLQMDLSFQRQYGSQLLGRKGTADRWTPLEQMWVAERAHRSGRGFYPWPNTARYCGLI